ncbi:HPHL1-like protein, partial [Mya arenaria]
VPDIHCVLGETKVRVQRDVPFKHTPDIHCGLAEPEVRLQRDMPFKGTPDRHCFLGEPEMRMQRDVPTIGEPAVRVQRDVPYKATPDRYCFLGEPEVRVQRDVPLKKGMQAFINIGKCNRPQHVITSSLAVQTLSKAQVLRTSYLAIEEIIWDYAPGLKSNSRAADIHLRRGPQRIGSRYKKAVFREYTDSTFTVRKLRSKYQTHYGLAGPRVVGEVGDIIEVVVTNLATRPYSFLADPRRSGAIVPIGAVRVYKFDVLQNSAPTHIDPDCLTYPYHSAVDVQKDIYSGLFGPMVICKPGTLTKSGTQKLFDREFFLNWMVIDENLSWYIDKNIQTFTTMPWTVNKKDRSSVSSNQMRDQPQCVRYQYGKQEHVAPVFLIHHRCPNNAKCNACLSQYGLYHTHDCPLLKS